MTLLVIRHASAGRRELWDDRDRLRTLDAVGRTQADALVETLGDLPLDAVLSSPYARCRQTVEPLAISRGLTVQTAPLLAEGTSTDQVLELLATNADANMALCTHGDVLGALLGELAIRGVTMPDSPRWEMASTWILATVGQRIAAVAFRAPPQVATNAGQGRS